MTAGCGSIRRQWRHGREQRDEAFRDGRVRDDERPNRRIGQVGRHGQLHDGKKFSNIRSKGSEAEDAVVCRDEGLYETAGL